MSDLNKNILITPNVGQEADPSITFVGRNNTPIYLKVLDDGTVSFEGTTGQLLGITDTADGSLVVMKNKQGTPALEILEDGVLKLTEYASNVLIGTGIDNTVDKVQINGTVLVNGLHSLTDTNNIDGFTIDGGVY